MNKTNKSKKSIRGGNKRVRKLTQRKYKAKGGTNELVQVDGGETIKNTVPELGFDNKFVKIDIYTTDNQINISFNNLTNKNNILIWEDVCDIIERILSRYPNIKDDDIRASIEYIVNQTSSGEY